MLIKFNLESPIKTYEQFEEILLSYKQNNVICGTCNPGYYVSTDLIESCGNYLKLAESVGLSRIIFRWDNVFDDYNLEHEDITSIIRIVSRFFCKHTVIFGIMRKGNDLILEFMINPEYFREYGRHVANTDDMLYLERFFFTCADTCESIVYTGADTIEDD